MPQRILFYISGHGYGHGRRVGQVVRALAAQAPTVEVFVRTSTSVPARLFAPLPPQRIEASNLDAGMAEDGPLAIDAEGTLRRLVDLLGRREPVVAEEVAAVRRIAPTLIVADIPFLAGDVADASGVPCVGMSNFTWDWICDPLLGDDPRYAPVRRQIVEGYGKMQAILQLPFGGVSEAFRERIPVPLVAGRSTRDPFEFRGQLGIHSRDDRTVVLAVLRGGLPDDVLRTAAAGSPDCLFLVPQPRRADVPANVVNVTLSPELDFSDLMAVCDVVVSKLGYGIVADCIAAGKALLWPRRTGFREDAIVEAEGPRYLRMREIGHEDFRAGTWAGALTDLLAAPAPPETAPHNGAGVCAKLLASMAGPRASA